MLFETKEERVQDFFTLAKQNKVEIPEEFSRWLKEEGFFDAPASTKYHGNYPGGLYEHSKTVYERLLWLTYNNSLHWQRPQSPFIIGMFHDLCKYDNYKKVFGTEIELQPGIKFSDANIAHYEYNTNTLLKGHATKSIILLSQFMTLTEEEMLCIRFHMGPYGNETEQKEEWAGFDKASRKTNGLVLWVHHADQLASKVDDI